MEGSAQQPPATAGRIVTESPSLTWVSSAPVKRTSSSLTYTLTNRCSLPSSVTRRPLRPGCWLSRSSTSWPRVAPLPSTVFAPPVWVRRMVGIRTSMAMLGVLLGRVWGPRAGCRRRTWQLDRATRRRRGRFRTAGGPPAGSHRERASGGGQEAPSSVVDDGGRRVAEQVGLDDLDVLLGDLAVDDPENAELDLAAGPSGLGAVVPGGDEHVVGVRLGGVADVGARGVGLGGRVRVVDDD